MIGMGFGFSHMFTISQQCYVHVKLAALTPLREAW